VEAKGVLMAKVSGQEAMLFPLLVLRRTNQEIHSESRATGWADLQ